MSADDPWADVRSLTPARVALGRTGSALPTSEVLRFALAHARARDAVHVSLDVAPLDRDLRALGHRVLRVASAAPDRTTYLSRPDLGRRLSRHSLDLLMGNPVPPCDLIFVVADGLSAPAAASHAAPLLAAMSPWLARSGIAVGPVVLATQARVALGDEVGMLCDARTVAVLIGERPGLSAPDSLGVYLTYAPKPGRHDAERNCISNIRQAGLSYEAAAFKLSWLVEQALTRELTGVALKDESDALLLDQGTTVPSLV